MVGRPGPARCRCPASSGLIPQSPSWPRKPGALGYGIAVAVYIFLSAAGAAQAQTAVSCQTAAQIVADSPYAGSSLTLQSQYDHPDTVDRLVKGRFGNDLNDRPDLVQVYYLGNGRFLIMASVQGCHVAHEFSDDAG